jgi:alginate O-acetyltransferase complex protein AlgJ
MLGLGVAAAWGADNASVPVTADGSRERAAALVAQAGDKGVIEGRDGWLFLTAELRFLAAGEFWGAAAGKVSSAAKPEWADPLPAILDFHAQVKKAGATLIFAPVPPKAVVYPDRLPGSEGPAPKTRSDAATARFLDVLRTNGVQVLDLAPAFLEYRARHGDANERRLYCQTDSHWSPLACGLTAAGRAHVHRHAGHAGHRGRSHADAGGRRGGTRDAAGGNDRGRNGRAAGRPAGQPDPAGGRQPSAGLPRRR